MKKMSIDNKWEVKWVLFIYMFMLFGLSKRKKLEIIKKKKKTIEP